jgi:hypothetical protein
MVDVPVRIGIQDRRAKSFGFGLGPVSTPVPGRNKVHGIYEIVNKSKGKNLMGDGARRELKGPGKPTSADEWEGLGVVESRLIIIRII